MQAIPPNPFRESRLNSDSDYRPEWDVPDLNGKLSTWLADEVRRLAGRAAPDPGQMIAVITGPPGYGKTHLFGRIEHQVGRDVFFVFVPAFEPEAPPLDHVRRHVVRALFKKAGDRPAAIERALAELCRPALAGYFAELPPTLAARHGPIRQRLAESADAALEVARAVKNLPPFARLADSLVSVLPGDAGVTRALALGWAPAPWSDTARRWLEGQDLPESDLQAVGLAPEPPTAMDVLRAIPALFGHQRPMMICCDQIEGILQGEDRGARVSSFTQSLMDLLQAIPVQIVLSCFEDSWEGTKSIDGVGGAEGLHAFHAFQMRVRQPIFGLDAMKPGQAVRLVANRMATWPAAPAERPPTWPFNEATIKNLVVDFMPTPRGLIQECARQFDAWCEGDRLGEIPPPPPPGEGAGPASLTASFLAEWAAEVEAIKRDPARSAGQQDQERLYRGVLEALKLAHSAQRLRPFGGVRIVDIQDRVIKATAPLKRPGAAVTLAGGPGEPAFAVVVALTTIESAQSFNAYFTALNRASEGTAGLVLVHPRRELALGSSARTWRDLQQKQGRFRLLALEDYPLTYQALEAFIALLERAKERELILDGTTLTPEDVRDLVIKTGVIDNLDLFKLLGHARKPAAQAEATAGAPGATPAVAPAAKPGATPAGAGSPWGGVQAQADPGPKPTPAAPKAVAKEKEVDHAPWAEDKLAKAVAKLKLFGLEVRPAGFVVGPTFVRLQVEPLGKTDFAKVRNRAVDLRISLGLAVVPIVASQPGFISIDVQRPDRAVVGLDDALADPPAGLDGRPAFPVGRDVAGEVHWLDLAEPADCHLLVAGTTGSGKSEFLRAAVAALAARLGPDRLRFVLIDPKRVTFNLPRPSPYLRDPVAHDMDEALPVIEACMAEMDRRYAILEKMGKSNVGELDAQMVPRIVVVIDEFASFLEDKESKKVVTALLKRIGAMARAAGIHLILATQRPDKDVVTPILRENLPGRIALRVSSKAGSDLILGSPEAEHLLGQGDLFWKKGGELRRLQSPYVAQTDLEALLRIAPA